MYIIYMYIYLVFMYKESILLIYANIRAHTYVNFVYLCILMYIHKYIQIHAY